MTKDLQKRIESIKYKGKTGVEAVETVRRYVSESHASIGLTKLIKSSELCCTTIKTPRT